MISVDDPYVTVSIIIMTVDESQLLYFIVSDDVTKSAKAYCYIDTKVTVLINVYNVFSTVNECLVTEACSNVINLDTSS